MLTGDLLGAWGRSAICCPVTEKLPRKKQELVHLSDFQGDGSSHILWCGVANRNFQFPKVRICNQFRSAQPADAQLLPGFEISNRSPRSSVVLRPRRDFL